jgi:Homeodomain-like domain
VRPGESPKEDAERHERSLKAVELRRKGLSYPAIAKELGCSWSTAYAYVQKHFDAIDKLGKEQAEQLRALELTRLDKYIEALEPACTEGDPKAILAAIKAGEARRKLLGLDAPAKVDHTITDERKKLAEMSPEDRIKLHEQAIAEERARLAEGLH